MRPKNAYRVQPMSMVIIHDIFDQIPMAQAKSLNEEKLKGGSMVKLRLKLEDDNRVLKVLNGSMVVPKVEEVRELLL